MAIDYHHSQYLLHMLYAPFWLGLSFTLVNNTNLMLSKLRYLAFTEWKIQSLLSCLIVQGSSSCCTSCTALLPPDDFWPCLPLFLCDLAGCMKIVYLATSTMSWHRWGYASVGALYHNICSFLSFLSHFHHPFAVYYYHASSCLF